MSNIKRRKRSVYPRFHADGTRCTLASDYPAIAKEWDYERNEGSPEDYLPSSAHRAHWVCPHGHHYAGSIDKRTQRGDGCPYCSGKKVLAGFNDLLTKMPELAVEWHPDKNELFPTEVTPGSRKRAWWICPHCGNEYEAEIANRTIHHSACPKCRYKRSVATRKKHNQVKRNSSPNQ